MNLGPADIRDPAPALPPAGEAAALNERLPAWLKLLHDAKRHTIDEQLAGWVRRREALSALFNPHELSVLESRRLSINPADRHIVYVTYENPWAKSGGITAVARHLPPALVGIGERVTRLSFYHRNLADAPKESQMEKLTPIFEVPFGDGRVPSQVFRLRDGGQESLLIGARDFFLADGGATGRDPHLSSEEDQPQREGADSQLLKNSLFACRALPYAMLALGSTRNLIFHLQDWHLAPAALTVKEGILQLVLESAGTLLTLHNPYDHWLPRELLALITQRESDHGWPAIGSHARDTALSRMIPLTDTPVPTVSRVFAHELTRDPLQTGHFAEHLQNTFRYQGVVGIDNGRFLEAPVLPFSLNAVKEAGRGQPARILAEKHRLRDYMLQALRDYLRRLPAAQREQVIGGWTNERGGSFISLDENVPIFMMFGHLDPGQKGFDSFLRAVEHFPRGRSRFVMCLPGGGQGSEGYLEDLRRVARLAPGELLVFPFSPDAIFAHLMAGASWVVFPSFYEPFGSATEPYLRGTPVIARATGGLMQQVTDGRINAARMTGILYREADEPGPAAGRDWKAIQLGPQWEDLKLPDRPAQPPDLARRMEIPLYRGIVEGLTEALLHGEQICRNEPALYGRMLSRVYPKARTFRWTNTARDFARLYDTVSR